MTHIRGAPCHPQTQGKIGRWHQTLKNRILLEHAYLPGKLEAQDAAFVEHYNHVWAHESLGFEPNQGDAGARAAADHAESTWVFSSELI